MEADNAHRGLRQRRGRPERAARAARRTAARRLRLLRRHRACAVWRAWRRLRHRAIARASLDQLADDHAHQGAGGRLQHGHGRCDPPAARAAPAAADHRRRAGPEAGAVLTRTGRVGVFATRGTLASSQVRARCANRCAGSVEFVLQPCDGLAARHRRRRPAAQSRPCANATCVRQALSAAARARSTRWCSGARTMFLPARLRRPCTGRHRATAEAVRFVPPPAACPAGGGRQAAPAWSPRACSPAALLRRAPPAISRASGPP